MQLSAIEFKVHASQNNTCILFIHFKASKWRLISFMDITRCRHLRMTVMGEKAMNYHQRKWNKVMNLIRAEKVTQMMIQQVFHQMMQPGINSLPLLITLHGKTSLQAHKNLYAQQLSRYITIYRHHLTRDIFQGLCFHMANDYRFYFMKICILIFVLMS